MLQALSPPSNAKPPASTIMTLGLDRDRKIAAHSKYNSEQDKVVSKVVPPSGKPKTLLSCKCTELKTTGLSVLHSVQLLLTSYREVLVFKRTGDKSHSQTVLRRHSAAEETFREHPILPNALLVEVPHTLLKYVYQLDKEKTVRQWLGKIATCRSEVLGNAMQMEGALASSVRNHTHLHSIANIAISSPLLNAKNTTSTSAITSTATTPVTTSRGGSRSSNRAVSPLGGGGGYSHGPCSPEPQYRTIMAIGREPQTSQQLSEKTPDSSGRGTGDKTSDREVTDAVPADVSNPRDDLCSPTITIATAEDLFPPSTVHTHVMDDRHLQEEPSTFDTTVASGCSSACLSRNSSARSSSRSLGNVSARSLNMSALQDSLETSCKVTKERRFSTSNDNTSFSLAEKRSGLVRRASDQLVGLLKMHSFRERRVTRKAAYTRISASVSELDSFIADGREVDNFIAPLRPPRHSPIATPTSPRRPTRHSPTTTPTSPRRPTRHSPTTTPTSPLARSLAVSPILCADEGEGLETTPEEEEEEEGEGLKTKREEEGEECVLTPGEEEEEEEGEGFMRSKFHHIQIRNRKWIQSPRISRAFSTSEGVSGGGTTVYSRSTSESPTANSANKLDFR